LSLDGLIEEVYRSWFRDWELAFGGTPPDEIATANKQYAFYLVHAWTERASGDTAAILDWLEEAATERYILRETRRTNAIS
jgi:hypothetical protein